MTDETEHADEEGLAPLDEKAAKDDIAAGARALKELKKTAGRNWDHWSAAIRGWRGLRELAFLRAGTRDTKAQAYRDSMTYQLGLVKNFEYRDIEKETRSAMTRLIGHIDEIDAWHAALQVWEKERWTNPQTIVKHAPKHLLIGQSHNQPKRKTKPKKKGNPEAESLRAVLIKVIRRLAKYEPDALDLLDDLYVGASDPDDGLDDLPAFDAESDEE